MIERVVYVTNAVLPWIVTAFLRIIVTLAHRMSLNSFQPDARLSQQLSSARCGRSAPRTRQEKQLLLT